MYNIATELKTQTDFKNTNDELKFLKKSKTQMKKTGITIPVFFLF